MAGSAPSEADIARIWAREALPGTSLTLVDGTHLCVLCSGRPNHGSGPDFQDAVLLDKAGRRQCGDVEIHRRTSDWRRHGHHQDARYNRVLLHVVYISDDGPYTPLASGAYAPVLALDFHLARPSLAGEQLPWPCQDARTRLTPTELDSRLIAAGMARFAERVARFTIELHTVEPVAGWAREDTVLVPAIAEGLGYGRDRAIFRQAALALLAHPNTADAPRIGLDAHRYDGLVVLMNRWRHEGCWPHCHVALMLNSPTTARQTLEVALAVDVPGARTALISRARAAIIVCNVVLPFAVAIGNLAGDPALVATAVALYQIYPSLASNRITRAMAAQLRLDGLPRGAVRQQGLHHLHRHFCAAKLCGECPCRGPLPTTGNETL